MTHSLKKLLNPENNAIHRTLIKERFDSTSFIPNVKSSEKGQGGAVPLGLIGAGITAAGTIAKGVMETVQTHEKTTPKLVERYERYEMPTETEPSREKPVKRYLLPLPGHVAQGAVPMKDLKGTSIVGTNTILDGKSKGVWVYTPKYSGHHFFCKSGHHKALPKVLVRNSRYYCGTHGDLLEIRRNRKGKRRTG